MFRLFYSYFLTIFTRPLQTEKLVRHQELRHLVRKLYNFLTCRTGEKRVKANAKRFFQAVKISDVSRCLRGTIYLNLLYRRKTLGPEKSEVGKSTSLDFVILCT
jgi:hypothetical protein